MMETSTNSSAINAICDVNCTEMFTETPTPNVHDKPYNVVIRLIVLYLNIIFGIIGGILVILWMWYNRKRGSRSRINALILNLTIADLLVIFFGCLPQLIWEYYGRSWDLGTFMCLTTKFIQSFSLMASSNMLIVIAFDRHQAIRAPLKNPIPVWKMTGCGWILAALCSLPMFAIFHVDFNVKYQEIRCENTFRFKPDWHRQLWITYVTFVAFFIPLFAVGLLYFRIFQKIAQKANERKTGKHVPPKPGRINLQATTSGSFTKAKSKTLKMTVVIVASFILFGFPYFVCELIMSYGDHEVISSNIYALLGGIAAANSSLNPFIFLLFNANMQCVHSLFATKRAHKLRGNQILYSNNTNRSVTDAHTKCAPNWATSNTELVTVTEDMTIEVDKTDSNVNIKLIQIDEH